MKKSILILTFFFLTISTTSQNIFNTTGDALLDGTSLKIKAPSTTGGWARGVFYYNNTDIYTSLGGYGILGSGDTTINHLYLAHGAAPWGSGLGLYIRPNGFTGIGTTTPNSKLEVNGNIGFNGQIISTNAQWDALSSVNIRLGYNSDNNTTGAFHIYNGGISGGNEVFTISNSNNVGIGTIAPSAKLDVKGDFKIGNDSYYTDLIFKTGSAISGSNGVFEIVPKTIPGSGTSKQTTYFKNASHTSGTTVHNVVVDGNVGIGTTTPTKELDINGEITSSKGASFGTNSVHDESDISFGELLSLGPNSNFRWSRDTDTSNSFVHHRVYDLNNTLRSWYLYDSENTEINYRNNGGNIFYSLTENQDYLSLNLKHQSSSISWGMDFQDDSVYGSMKLNNKVRHKSVFEYSESILEYNNRFEQSYFILTNDDDNETRLSLPLENSRLAIGTAIEADYHLTVKGKIHSQEVRVDLEGAIAPDYVFEKYYNGDSKVKPEYKIPTLKEVQAYTKANHHLPEMPSAKEMQENGMQLKEMNLKLLEKIEELTLYTIEQQKELDTQKEKNNALETRLTKIEALLQSSKK